MTKKLKQVDDRFETLPAEVLLFSLLGRLLYGYPDEEQRTWIQSLLDEDLFSDAPLAGGQPQMMAGLELISTWSDEIDHQISQDVFEALQSDYNRLFVGPGEVLAPPWGSIYLNEEPLTLQKETLDVREWYRRFGVEVAKLYSEPDDHIGLELEFIAHLSRLSLQALEEDDRGEANRLLREQHRFVRAHPGQWILAWQELVHEHGRTGLYCGAASMTVGAIKALLASRQAEYSALT